MISVGSLQPKRRTFSSKRLILHLKLRKATLERQRRVTLNSPHTFLAQVLPQAKRFMRVLVTAITHFANKSPRWQFTPIKTSNYLGEFVNLHFSFLVASVPVLMWVCFVSLLFRIAGSSTSISAEDIKKAIDSLFTERIKLEIKRQTCRAKEAERHSLKDISNSKLEVFVFVQDVFCSATAHRRHTPCRWCA